jgi:hypothetical protein
MRTNRSGSTITFYAVIVFAAAISCRPCLSQQVAYALLQPDTMQPVPMQPVVSQPAKPVALPNAPEMHRFWDGENSILFAASAAFSTADFIATRDNLRNGGRELNPITRVFTGSTPMLAMNFAGETAGVIGLSYFFHKTGHHKLERAVSMLNISSSAAAVTFDLAHR